MTTSNTWVQESPKYHITTITLGDTELEIYGEVVGPDPSIGYLGDVDIHDVRIVAPDGKLSTSIWELVNLSPDLMGRIEQEAFEGVL